MNTNTALDALRRNCASEPTELPTNYRALKRQPTIADGSYNLEIVESAYLANDGGTGMVLRFLLQVIDGPWPSALLTLDVTLEHEDDLVAADGQREFAALRCALNVPVPEDTEELHFIALRATVGRRTVSAGPGVENYFSALHSLVRPRTKRVHVTTPEAPQHDARGPALDRAA